MSQPICKISDLIFTRFKLVDLDKQKEFMNHFGCQLAYETDNSIFFKGSGSYPYIYVASKGDQNKCIGMAYKVNAFEDLQNLSTNLNVEIVDNDEPGGGKKVTLIDPEGLEIEIYYGINEIDPEIKTSPKLNTGNSTERIKSNSPNDGDRVNELQRIGQASDEWQLEDDKWVYNLRTSVKRVGHTAINCKDAKESIRWYSENLGLLVTNYIMGPDGSDHMGAFMRADTGDIPAEHHILNNVQFPGDGDFAPYGHAGYEVSGSVDDLMAGHHHLKSVDKYPHEWGIGRHLLGSQMYDYWRDAYGFTHEHWTDGDFLDSSHPPEKTPFRDTIMAQYGPFAPSSFGVSVPNDQLEEVRKNPRLDQVVAMVERGEIPMNPEEDK